MGALQISTTDIPSFLEFSPKKIRWQWQAAYDIEHFPYVQMNPQTGLEELHTYEILFSGSVGSAKSILLAHLIVKHCMKYRRAKVGIGRESLKDLKDTLFALILEHMDGSLEEGKDYKINGKGHIVFKNGSRIIPFGWHDKRYKKFRSHSFSLFIIEELTENKTQEFYDEIKMRMGRMTKIPVSAIICATNPDDPAHWAYEYFIQGSEKNPLIKVYYSITEQNPYLNPSYVRGLQMTLDPKKADRMLRGRWVSILTDKIYYCYDDKESVLKHDRDLSGKIIKNAYQIDGRLPVGMAWDFNIGVGKPMSMCLFQHIPSREIGHPGQFIFFDEFVIEGTRTRDILEEFSAKGYLELGLKWEVFGDASMTANDTRSIKTDYDIIKHFLSNYSTRSGESVRFEMKVPLANPPIRARHNIVNGALKNDLGHRNLLVTENCSTIRKGLMLTALKPGAEYIEDDSKAYQHVTTALGYAVVKILKPGGNFKTTVT